MFENIIGYESTKKELSIIVDMFRNPEKYDRIGAKPVSGVLLYGAPGTGKTTMLKDMIDACGVPTYVLRKDKANDQFIDTICEAFEEAKKNAPSIVFMDDMDKFADTDDRCPEEYAVVQSCIDDVKDAKVLALATVNEPDRLPRSLRRAGRFDKTIKLGNPGREDCEKIVRHYLDQKGCSADIDYHEVARLLGGCNCATLEAIINEAGIMAAFDNRDSVSNQDIINATLNVVYDTPAAVSSESSQTDPTLAYHEAGHAVISELLEPGSINIISTANRSGDDVGGFTSYQQAEEYFNSIDYMENRVMCLLGGKAANDIVFGITDVGCNDDLNRAYDIVSRFIDNYCSYGFNNWEGICEHLGNSDGLMSRKETLVSFEMSKYYQKVRRMLIENRPFLDKLAETLMKDKVITYHTVQNIKNSCYQTGQAETAPIC
ncbi:MAG: AAA family ATPase [Erysipelotrichaceae bacterium]|nr:AAA family ATPase [Erysipelotrichaceae bacterium]